MKKFMIVNNRQSYAVSIDLTLWAGNSDRDCYLVVNPTTTTTKNLTPMQNASCFFCLFPLSHLHPRSLVNRSKISTD